MRRNHSIISIFPPFSFFPNVNYTIQFIELVTWYKLKNNQLNRLKNKKKIN